ncbi:MAG: EpsG family protein [Ruminococcus sp.]
MWVWLWMLASIVIIRFLVSDGIARKKKNLIFLILCFAIIVFVAGSRSPHLSQSSDLYNYFKWYGRAMNRSMSELLRNPPMEAGYLILNKILAWIVPWNYFIIYFEAAFCTGVMLWYIYRNADSVFLAVIIYICVGPWQFFLTGFRQSIAICICFIALELVKKRTARCDVFAVLLILLATAMHTTAWVFLAVFVLRRMKISKNLFLYFVIMMLLIFIFKDELLKFGNDVLGRGYTDAYKGSPLAGIIPITIYAGALVLQYLLYRTDKEVLSRNEQLEFIILMAGMCVYAMRYNLHIMERISFYFTPVISVVLTNGITRQKTKALKYISYAVCLCLCIGLYMYRTVAQYGDYHFYWEYLERIITI